jgi:hypothetical protein
MGHGRAILVKMKTNAAMDQNRNHADLAKAEEQELRRIAKDLLGDAERIDQAEDALYGAERGDEHPPGVRKRKERWERIRAAKKQLEEEAAERAKEQEAKAKYRAEREARAAARHHRFRLPRDEDSTGLRAGFQRAGCRRYGIGACR